MPQRPQTPAPIDRPLSRAYLRQFLGWSTAYPPGMSEPTSLRLMENVMVNRDGSVRVRPGLRYLSYTAVPHVEDGVPGSTTTTTTVVGTHEPFFDNDGKKAYLYAVREASGIVSFRVLQETLLGQIVRTLSDVGFDVPQTEAVLNFTSATTYVKYLQIDNKIFALSNAGESMRLFTVGTSKSAKKLNSIERPNWTVADKLTVVHPDAAWVNSGVPTGIRTNYSLNPSFTTAGLENWTFGPLTGRSRSSTFAAWGPTSMRLESLPTRTNYIQCPLHSPSSTGFTGWANDTGADDNPLTVVSDSVRVRINTNATYGLVYSRMFPVTPGQVLRAYWDLTNAAQLQKMGLIVRYYDANGAGVTDRITVNTGLSNAIGRRQSSAFTVPAGAVQMRIMPTGYRSAPTGTAYFDFNHVAVVADGDGGAFFYGGSGTDYFWTGTVNDSASVYHPPVDLVASMNVPAGAGTFTGSVYIRAGSTVRSCRMDVLSYGPGGGTPLATDTGTAANDVSGGWTARTVNTATSPAGTASMTYQVFILAVPRGEYHYLDQHMIEQAGSAGTWFDGSSTDIPTKGYDWLGAAYLSASTETAYSVGNTNPPAETKTTLTLIDSTAADNVYSVGMFYTFSNEIGESAVSQVTVTRVQRPWSAWRWETPNASGEPSGTATQDPTACADQLVAYMASDIFADAIAAGATSWSLYAFTWSDQDPVPVTAVKVAERLLTTAATYGVDSWARMTPSQAEASAETAVVPTLRTRYNSSNPSCGAQGIVAADRMVLVHDPTAQAVIRWSSNQQGSYSNFSPSKGGGYKTLTSGNLFIPATVKLWQNPQSNDTLTILCQGVDGYSTGYYMAPAEISSQSESVQIMAFEETTATPGTTSPFGCEVMNNALYHPLDEQLMKSVASNYNINHTSLTDDIADRWTALVDKDHIVSSQHDNRIYYLVNNPEGEPLPAGCWGNEVWVFDGAQKAGSWSRWLTPGISLRKIEVGGRVVMSLIHPSGIYYFDELTSTDDFVSGDGTVLSQPIPWMFETNTQGANRAHDAWCHLQQLDAVFGFFTGALEFGVKGWDVHGQPIEKVKLVLAEDGSGTRAWDVEDFLLVERDMKEWFFFARSATISGATQPSSGQVSLVQYRYAPISVNVGYEYGSVETFEYGRAGNANATTDNGVPTPFVDTRRP